MKNELRKVIPSIVVSLVLIRFWNEVITATILSRSSLINSINSTGWFHHWQLGFILLLTVAALRKMKAKVRNLSILEGFAIALIVDQYTYIFAAIGLSLPFKYRSLEDYLIEVAVIFLLLIFWFWGKKSSTGR